MTTLAPPPYGSPAPPPEDQESLLGSGVPAPKQLGWRQMLFSGRSLPTRGAGPRGPRPPLTAPMLVILTVVALAAWAIVYGLLLSGFQEGRSQRALYADFRDRLSGLSQSAPPPLGGAITPGAGVAMLEAPKGGLHRLVVVEGTASQQLQQGPGHRRDTVLPGQPGVSLIYGRSVTYGAPFGDITSLKKGDPITVTTGEGVFHYVVTGQRRAGQPVPTLASGGSRLSLATSEGTGWRKGWAPDHLVYVDATLKGSTQPAPSGRPSSVPKAEKPMEPDTGGLVPLLLWSQALLLAVAAFAWAWVKWGRRPTWLVGVPLVLAPLWGVTEAAARLLPNLF